MTQHHIVSQWLGIMAKMSGMVLGLFVTLTSSYAQSLEECQQAAEQNYPLIRQYGLIEQTTKATLDNIDKGWLPQLSTYAQVAAQNRVANLPDYLAKSAQASGINTGGLRKEQYKIGVDVQQVIYDGGQIRQQKEVVRKQSEVQAAQNDINLYALRQRVNDLYFGLLLLQDKVMMNHDLQQVLLSSEQKIANMVKGGTAATSDLDAIRAERMSVRQNSVELVSQHSALMRTLSLFIGKPVTKVEKPQIADVDNALLGDATLLSNNRPELSLFQKQIALTDAQKNVLESRLRPTLGAFAQGFYGYPGYDLFRDMMHHTPSLNGIIGLKFSWNIGALYTRKNDQAVLNLQRQNAENARDVFLFNNKLQTTQQSEDIQKYRKLQQQDDEIIRLRTNVRKAAESKLSHGIIDVNALVKEINNENSAKILYSIHEIQLLKAVYDMKTSLNR